MANDRRTPLHPKIRPHTYQRIYISWYHTAKQHSKLPRQQTGATASKYRQAKGGSHESGRFYPGATAATAATDRHRQPAALLFVTSRSYMNSINSTWLQYIYQLNNSTTRMSVVRQASPTVVPNLIMRAPALRFKLARHPT